MTVATRSHRIVRRRRAPSTVGDIWTPELWTPEDRALGFIMADLLDPPLSPYVDDPVGWVQHKGGFLWSKQQEVLASVRDNRFTSVRACHGPGKSYVASEAAAWWLDTHEDAFVVTSAPSAQQVKAILWREIKRRHRKGGLAGHITEGEIPEWKIDGELRAFGRKPADYVDAEKAMQSFQGIHALHVLVILDEACGIPHWLWTAAESLVTNERSRILAIGNPDDPASEFATVCKPGSGWNVISISAFDMPWKTGEYVPPEITELLTGRKWVEERARRWGVSSPTYVSKVLGEFPKVATDTLIAPALIEAAQIRDLSAESRRAMVRYGCDIADTGKDETVILANRGGHIRIAELPSGRLCVWQGQDTMQTAGSIAQLLKADQNESSAIVDAIGVGAGVYSRLMELGLNVAPFRASNRAWDRDKFLNRRSEQWWAVRELFEQGLLDIDPDDDDLAAQLGVIKWKVRSTGQTQIEPKEETIKRTGGSSPDRADALMMSTVPWDANPPQGERVELPPLEDDMELTAGLMEAPL